MISWIQNTFQHHFRTIFAALLVVIIISFVFVTNASSGLGGGDRHGITERMVFGYNLASQDDQNRLFGDAGVSSQLQAGYGLDGAELQEYGLQRAAALHIADQLHIPASTKQEVADYIKSLRVFAGQDGQFDASRYTMFRDSLKGNGRLNEAAVSRVLADDVRANKVQQLLGGPGYVQPDDIQSLLSRGDTRWTLGVATIDYASFTPNVPVTDALLTKFYEDNTFRYEIAPRVSISSIDFPAVAYMTGISLTEPEVRAFYETNPARFPKPATDAAGKDAPADPNAAYNAVRPQVEAALRLERAQQFAVKAASDFAFMLFDRKIKPGTPEFEALLSAQKLKLQPLAPFTQESGPAEFGGSPQIAQEAFKLGATRLTSEAVPTPVGAAVLVYNETLPARTPGFAEVRGKVLADYTEDTKRKRFLEFARTLRAGIQSRLKAGDSFEKAVAASAAGVKIESRQVAPFTLRQPPQEIDYALLGSIDRLEKGGVSEVVMTQAAKGLLAYVVDKQVPDFSENNPSYASTRAQLASANSRIGANAYLGELVRAELDRTEPKPQ